MLSQNGTIDDNPIIGGKPDAYSDSRVSDGNAGGTGEPEIIGGGYEDPATERIAGIGTGEPRRTKSGKIDGRTLRGKRGQSTGETGTEKSVHLSKIDLTELLLSIHTMGAEILNTTELELDKDEARKLSEAIQDVAKYKMLTFDPYKVAIFNLCCVAGGIYGTRALAIRNRLKMENETKPGPVAVPSKPAQKTNGAPAVDFSTMTPSQAFGVDSGASL